MSNVPKACFTRFSTMDEIREEIAVDDPSVEEQPSSRKRKRSKVTCEMCGVTSNDPEGMERSFKQFPQNDRVRLVTNQIYLLKFVIVYFFSSLPSDGLRLSQKGRDIQIIV